MYQITITKITTLKTKTYKFVMFVYISLPRQFLR